MLLEFKNDTFHVLFRQYPMHLGHRHDLDCNTAPAQVPAERPRGLFSVPSVPSVSSVRPSFPSFRPSVRPSIRPVPSRLSRPSALPSFRPCVLPTVRPFVRPFVPSPTSFLLPAGPVNGKATAGSEASDSNAAIRAFRKQATAQTLFALKAPDRMRRRKACSDDSRPRPDTSRPT